MSLYDPTFWSVLNWVTENFGGKDLCLDMARTWHLVQPNCCIQELAKRVQHQVAVSGTPQNLSTEVAPWLCPLPVKEWDIPTETGKQTVWQTAERHNKTMRRTGQDGHSPVVPWMAPSSRLHWDSPELWQKLQAAQVTNNQGPRHEPKRRKWATRTSRWSQRSGNVLDQGSVAKPKSKLCKKKAHHSTCPGLEDVLQCRHIREHLKPQIPRQSPKPSLAALLMPMECNLSLLRVEFARCFHSKESILHQFHSPCLVRKPVPSQNHQCGHIAVQAKPRRLLAIPNFRFKNLTGASSASHLLTTSSKVSNVLDWSVGSFSVLKVMSDQIAPQSHGLSLQDGQQARPWHQGSHWKLLESRPGIPEHMVLTGANSATLMAKRI